MAYSFQGRRLGKVAVVGSGQIGPDIALHLSKVLAPHQTRVVVTDISQTALDSGRRRVEEKVRKGVETRSFKPEQAEAMLACLVFSAEDSELEGAELVIEAATEALEVKRGIVARLERLCPPDAILASNSSHLQPEEIFSQATRPERTLVIHYFFPAERNPAVEVVPGKLTDASLARWVMKFYEAIGKIPITVKSRYGYAIDPIFEGLCQAAMLGVEAGWGSVLQVDAMAARALGLGVGPFTAANLTGGNPILDHGLTEMGQRLSNWFASPELLKEQLERGQPWEVAGRGQSVEYSDEAYRRVERLLSGAYFGLVGQILDAGISNVADLEMALEMALVVRPPFGWMNEMGPREALARVEEYARTQTGFEVPNCLKAQAVPWEIPQVLREDVEGVAVLSIRRPRVLNALNHEVLAQLDRHLQAIEADPAILGVVLTGAGNKAFVSGSDIGILAAVSSPEEGERLSGFFQEHFLRLEDYPKPVVCALNGLALGGGCELAAACHARVAGRVQIGQPEVNLGIIPAAGGTQRLARWIGIQAAAKILRSGQPISADEAQRLGFVHQVVDQDPVHAAAELVRQVARGEVVLPPIPRGPLENVPDSLSEPCPDHLSAAVDAILCRALLQGARLALREGLELERQAFGDCCRLRDMRIGLENFLSHGPRSRAQFVNA
ncbi:3-hydroxyacyl-CoA dehydrogenase/enoyl-CoA hydratase family protein [bacterium CPR1]|nr:3-hydroxyacyl-CoA dehydrogenase/enoyl-CoA hydratase family protein [bacterium CPR1]